MKIPNNAEKHCTSITCPERRSKCCGAKAGVFFGDKDVGYFVCSKCHKEFQGNDCTAGERELEHCKVCNQMTNHLLGKCQKCDGSVDQILKSFDEMISISWFNGVDYYSQKQIAEKIKSFLLSSLQSYGKERENIGLETGKYLANFDREKVFNEGYDKGRGEPNEISYEAGKKAQAKQEDDKNILQERKIRKEAFDEGYARCEIDNNLSQT